MSADSPWAEVRRLSVELDDAVRRARTDDARARWREIAAQLDATLAESTARVEAALARELRLVGEALRRLHGRAHGTSDAAP
ncbi:MAG: hypothetical protein KF773_30930 [Deltaproteobacteria bacterium]|nr:hypothetical protein [Deltaproteobacteria bacterium]MCW5803610.1 hypothetical protein [Deltaproteobacteria bacterium]